MPDILDPYRSDNSPLHRTDARVKLALAVLGILTTAAVPAGAWPVFVLLLSGIMSLSVLAGLGVTFTLRRGWIALPFALAALPLLATTPGAAFLTLHLGHRALVVTGSGVERFLSLAIRSYLSVQIAVLLAATTPFTELLVAMRALRVPKLLVSVFALMWRYLFVLVHEARRLRIARDARSGSTSKRSSGTLAWRAKVTGGMVGNLFLRGYDRSERVYHAMLARGYDGEVRAFGFAPLSRGERYSLAAGVGVLGLMLLLGLLFGHG